MTRITIMKLEEIKIPELFINSIPKTEKMEECRINWEKYKYQDRFLVVNKNNILIDGYIQYLILKEKCINKAEVIICESRKKCYSRKRNLSIKVKPSYYNEPTTYVYGYHTRKFYTSGNPSIKEFKSKDYMWRVPKSWSELGWESDLKIGDQLYVNTCNGKKIITVSKIERLDKCPTNLRVRKVLGKVTKKNVG